MKPLALILFFLSITCAPRSAASNVTPQTSLHQAQSNIGERFARNWPAQRPEAYNPGRHCFEGDSPWSLVSSDIQGLLDRGKLTSKAKVSFTVRDDTDIPLYTIDKASGTPSDRFYCEQAIWESAPLPHFWPRGQIELGAASNSPNHQNTILLPDQFIPPKMVALRIIPASILSWRKFPSLFTDFELHSSHNVALLSVQDIDNPRLKAYRADWVSFISRRGLTRANTIAFASSLINKYHDILKLANSDEFSRAKSPGKI